MTTQHTPGPWHARVHSTYSHIWGPDGTKRGCIGSVNLHGDTSREEREANARLIAAAPELLEALRRAWALVDSQIRCNAPTENAIKLAADIRAAIARAEG